MGLSCCSNLNHTPLVRLNPTASYAKGEHLEVDYLLPVDDACLVGENTDNWLISNL